MLLEYIKAIYAAAAAPHSVKIVLAVAGGGATGVAQLLATAGASAAVLEATCPYSKASFQRFTGTSRVDGFAGPEAASELAAAALTRAKQLLAADATSLEELAASRPAGIGLAAAIPSVQPRRGDYLCCAAFQTDHDRGWATLIFDRDGLTRDAAEGVCSRAVVAMVGGAAGVPAPLPGIDLLDGVRASVNVSPTVSLLLAPSPAHIPARHATVPPSAGTDPLSALLAGDASVPQPVTHILYAPRPITDASTTSVKLSPSSSSTITMTNAPLHSRCLIVSGSFNPLHEGHVRMARSALKMLQTNGEASDRAWELLFELSATNVEKPPLPPEEVLRRVAQFIPAASSSTASSEPPPLAFDRGAALRPYVCHPACPVVVTRAPRFMDKARLFPGASFVLGVDTAARLVQV
jgi:hypothetical protein